MFIAFRAFRMIPRLIKPMRIGAPMVATNNYLRLYNLNTFYMNLLLESNEEEEEVL